MWGQLSQKRLINALCRGIKGECGVDSNKPAKTIITFLKKKKRSKGLQNYILSRLNYTQRHTYIYTCIYKYRV